MLYFLKENIINREVKITVNRTKMISILIISLLLGLSILSLAIGVEEIDYKSLLKEESMDMEILLISRIPRTISLLLTGAGLSICGVIMQQITQNKFISPTTAGTLDAAKLGILCALVFFPLQTFLTKLLVAVVVCLALSALFTFSISRIIKRSAVIIPVLGIMYGYMLNGIANVIGIHFNMIQNMESWMVGNFAKNLKGQYETIYFLTPLFLVCFAYTKRFTIAGLGKDFASNLGINFKAVLSIGLLLTAMMVSISMLTVGTIPFLDLIVPNLASILYGDNISKNMPYIAAFGSISLLFCDVIGRCMIFPYEIPSSMIVGSIGALTFLIILIKKGR